MLSKRYSFDCCVYCLMEKNSFEKHLCSFDKMIHSSQVCVKSFEKLSYSFRKRVEAIEKNCKMEVLCLFC